MRTKHFAFLAVLSLSSLSCSTSPFAPGDGSGSGSAKSSEVMVVTANPLATEVGLEIVKKGGSAVDAAIAIEAVLSLVEPQSSGFGGGAFMMHFDAQTGELTAYDGREVAPKSARKDMFLGEDGKPMGYFDAKNSGLSTGVPSVVAMLAMAHEDHGVLPWNTLFDDAKTLAEDGFEVSPRLNGILNIFGKYIPSTPEDGPTDGFEYLHDADGKPLPVGHILKNPDYAQTLTAIAEDPLALHKGPFAQAIVDAVGEEPRSAVMTVDEIANYKPLKRKPVCTDYRDMLLCGPPPASSWVAVGEVMEILEAAADFSADGPDDWRNWATYINAQRLAYADRDRYVADPAFVEVPVSGLLSEGYISERSSQLTPDAPVPSIAGDPWPFNDVKSAQLNGEDATLDLQGTTHFVIIDQEGDVVSMTATVESIFGSTRMVGGMFLNNQLTDFSFRYEDADGRPIANAAGPGKRPRSSMSPTIVLDKDGKFLMATGSPGGSNIIAYTSKTLVGMLDWGLSAQEAVALPNVVARGDTVRVEANTGSEALIENLEAAGFKVDGSRGENSGLSVIVKRPDGTLEGGADPRREGVVGK